MVEEKKIEKKDRSAEVTFRILQAACFGLFALGVSSGLSDWIGFIKLPFSQFTVVTTCFGFFGTIICEVMARVSRKW